MHNGHLGERDDAGWGDYLHQFHDQKPGITADVLGHAVDRGIEPYPWIVEAVGQGPVLDLACGSGPLAPALAGTGWVGVDASASELSVAQRIASGRVAQGHAGQLPLASASVGSVVCSMALMVIQPLDEVLAEVARVLRPGGMLVTLMPARAPLTPMDAFRYARLLAAFRTRRFGFPNDGDLDDVVALMGRHHLRVIDDQRRRFACLFTDPSVAVRFVRSLYLPGVEQTRLAAGERVARQWVGKELGLPLRRMIAVRAR